MLLKKQLTLPVKPGPFKLILCFILLSASNLIQAKEVTRQFNGLTINANLEMAKGKNYEDGMVLILHAANAHNKMEIIRTAQQVLLENDRSSLAINLSLGVNNRHGFLDCSQPQRHILDNSVYELAAWVAWLREQGTSQITAVGHSLGANQVMVYVVENRDPEVTHAVLMAPGHGEKDVQEIYKERYGYSLNKPLAIAYNQISSGNGDDLMEGIDTLLCPKSNITAYSFVSYFSTGNKFRKFGDYLSRSPIPTLVITGTEDDRQPNTVEFVGPYTSNNNIRLNVIEGAGHFFRDLNMDEAIEAAIEFIEE